MCVPPFKFGSRNFERTQLNMLICVKTFISWLSGELYQLFIAQSVLFNFRLALRTVLICVHGKSCNNFVDFSHRSCLMPRADGSGSNHQGSYKKWDQSEAGTQLAILILT